jgi:hypothetical protein
MRQSIPGVFLKAGPPRMLRERGMPVERVPWRKMVSSAVRGWVSSRTLPSGSIRVVVLRRLARRDVGEGWKP